MVISNELPNPFGDLGLDLSHSELRETAYEILAGASRSSGVGKPLTYVSNSEKTAERSRSLGSSAVASSSLQGSVRSSAASKVKKGLGLKSLSRKVSDSASQTQNSVSSARPKQPVVIGELMRVQMGISEQTDSRVRRGLLRVAAGQLGRRIELMVLPLELLQQFKSSDFATQQEYEAWQRRHLKILEAGLLLHPRLPLDKSNSASQEHWQVIRGASERLINTGNHTESMQVLRNAVMSLASRSLNGLASEACHWADGIPLNLRLYQILLEACFDVNEETSVIDEVDEVLELLKKTWVILGINQMLHSVCFSWILFHRYISAGQVENDLLHACENLLLEAEKDAKASMNPAYSKILSSMLSIILDWAENRLLSYHDNFYRSNIDVMQSVLSLGVLAAKMLAEDICHDYNNTRKDVYVAPERVELYIRTSVRAAFSQEREMLNSNKQFSKNQQNSLPVLSILAQDISDLAFNEKEIYSPALKKWHPLATGVAVATLHTCYRNELKKYVSQISELTPDVVQVLIAADKLENSLVKMAVEDSVDSEDGGKAIIQEMTPYEAEAVIADLAKSWIRTRVDRLKEWVDRNLQQEVWNPRANKERFAPSAVEVLRITDEILDAFFFLPMPMHPVLLHDLINGLDRCLQEYIMKAKSGCGSRNTFVPTLPALTRCKSGSKFSGAFRKKDNSYLVQRKRSQVGTLNGDNSFDISQLCVRINTLQRIRKELEVLSKRITNHLKNSGSSNVDCIENESGKQFDFDLSATASVEGIQQLCEATAYKVVFHDLCHVLWDGLYVGDVPSSRIEPFLQELEQNLEIISATVHDRGRTRVITDVLKASFDGFLLVLLAGGPSRAFTLQDYGVIEEDLKFLMDLFWSNGDGLPAELIDKCATTVKTILPLFHTNTDSLIELYNNAMLNNYGSTKSRFPLPPTSGQWSPTEPDTILRVLCHRNDKLATKFLKKTYNLPKKL